MAELRFGAAKSSQPARVTGNICALLGKISVVPFDEAATHRYGERRALIDRRGASSGPLDTLIASHALSLGWTLATHNTAKFRRAPGLSFVDWSS